MIIAFSVFYFEIRMKNKINFREIVVIAAEAKIWVTLYTAEKC